MQNRYICIHGHFYQPPRENAWLGEIERQPSAAPFHDWNERISSECYYANTCSRILNEDDKIIAIANNYAKMSFNFGATLLQWFEREQPHVHAAIVEADRLSLENFNGHGSAMAQVYNHLIMPLASRRDQQTQVRWGIKDFRYRFGRNPEGMWLAETAADTASLETLAAEGIKFTVLAPRQCKHIRPLGVEAWSSHLDTRRAYRCYLPSGKSITVFFYDGERSQDIAFRGMLNDGKRFAHRLLDGLDAKPSSGQLVHVATDGESYGHHHRHGDMALAYCLHYLEHSKRAQLTNYSQFLKLHPPTHEAEIHENSSWSCVHGVERWRSNCGCNTGEYSDQSWRKPLRQALNSLRDALEKLYEKAMKGFTSDVWALRDAYIEVVLRKKPLEDFLEIQIKRSLTEAEQLQVIYLLEIQHHAMLMFTSCAWFFDDVSRIETTQVLQYARRAVQLAQRIEPDNALETRFLQKLELAASNVPSQENGAKVYRQSAIPAQFDLMKVGMHFAAAKLLEESEETLHFPNYTCDFLQLSRTRIAGQFLLSGELSVRSKITHSRAQFNFLLVYLGDQHLFGQAYFQPSDLTEVTSAFEAGNLAQVMRLTQKIPDSRAFSFFDLRPDAQRQFLQIIVARQSQNAYEIYDRINFQTYNLLNLLKNTEQEIPPVLKQNMGWVLHARLEKVLTPCGALVNLEELQKIAKRYKKWALLPTSVHFNFLCTDRLTELEHLLLSATQDEESVLQNIETTLLTLRELNIFPALKQLQNTLYARLKSNAKPSEALKSLAKVLHFDVEAVLKK